MGIVEQQLALFVSRLFSGIETNAPSPGLCLSLRPLYDDGFNGGFFWGRALLIRPVQRTEGPLTITEWNDEALWKGQYDDVCRGVTFFAEDVFGVQFGVREERVVQFDPETAAIADVAATIDGWCMELRRDPEFYTGFPVLSAWERKNGRLGVGYRLIPRQLFMLGGDFDSSNMICKSDVEGMRVRAQFWRMTRDLPDGQKIVFRVED